MPDMDAQADAQAALLDDGMCFGCGPDNPIGLRLTFTWDGARCETHWTPRRDDQGWRGRAHGGMVALVLDEVLSRAALLGHGMVWVTAELTTRLLRPARVGVPLIGTAWAESVRGRLIVCAGELREAGTGALVASGRAKMMPARAEQERRGQNERVSHMVTEDQDAETPLERATRVSADAEDSREEHEADTLVADIDAYVAETAPGTLPAAERELNAWQIPEDPRDRGAGAGDDEELTPIFAAQTEAEAAIVRGLLEAQGIPTALDGLPSGILGNVFQAGEGRWGDILVPAGQADAARAAIAASQADAEETNASKGQTQE